MRERRLEEFDDVSAVLVEVCQALSRDPRLEFSVPTFDGIVPAPDIGTDLPVVLEQLPAIQHAMFQTQPTRLDFYEQGLEVRVRFQPQHTQFKPTLERLVDGEPLTSLDSLPASVLMAMFSELATRFDGVAVQAYPGLVNSPVYTEWLKEIVQPENAAGKPR
ncbi:MAG: hypothetical protein AAFX94_18725 [Myxococcota bacterium]